MSKASKAHPEPGTFTGADGQTYRVRPLSLNGLIKIEERYGFDSIEEAFDVTKLELHKPRNLRFLLATVLQEAHPDLTEEQTGSIITVAALPEASTAVVWALAAGLPEGKEEPTEEAKAGQDPRKSASGKEG